MNRLLPFFVIIIVAIAHATYIPNGFTWLDHNDIQSKHAVVSVIDIPAQFLKPFGSTSFYRPLVVASYSIDALIYKNRAWGYHLTNLLLHLLVVIISAYFFQKVIGLATREAWFAALIVGIHPGAIIITGSITQRQEPLMLAFSLLSVLFYAKKRIFWSYVCFILALCSKETALVIVPLLIGWHGLYNGLYNRRTLIGYGTIILAYLILRAIAVPHVWGTPITPMSIDQFIGTRLALSGYWIIHLLLPFKPSFSDAFPIYHILQWQSFLPLVIWICIGLYLFIKDKYSIYFKLYILLLILIIPALNIIPVPRVASPHYLYLPAIAYAALMVKKIPRHILYIWIAIASISSLLTGPQFKTDLTLFLPEVTRDARFIEGNQYLGRYYMAIKDYMESEKYLRQALVPYPEILSYRATADTEITLGGVLLSQGKLEEADHMYVQALTHASDKIIPFIVYNRALVAFTEKKYARVVELLLPYREKFTTKEPLLMLKEAEIYSSPGMSGF